jgi:ComF family protein
MTIQTIAQSLIDLVYPAHCHICKTHIGSQDDSGLCDGCRSGITCASGISFRICGDAKAYTVCHYEDAVKELIHLFKYNGKIRTGRFLASLMADFLRANPEIFTDIDVITSVPLHTSRLKKRGFNQSRMMALHISKETGLPFADILDKNIKTRNQNELQRDQRLRNLRGAFGIRKDADSINGLRILLVDDVITTGATLAECSVALSQAGALEVRCLALAGGAG